MICGISRAGRVGAIVVACWGLATSGAWAANGIPADQWVPGQDAKSVEGTLGVDIPDTSDVGDLLLGLKKPLTLQPGVYRIRAVVRPEPIMNMAYRIVLTVRSDKPTGQYKRWRPPPSLLTLRPKEIWHALDEARAVEHDDDGLVHLEAELAVTQAHAYQIAVGWKIGETQIGSVLKWSDAPAPLDRLTLVSLACEKLPRRVSLGTLKADRLVYKPSMVPTLSVPIAWTGDKPKTFGYQVRQTHGLDLVLPDAVRVWSVLVIRCELKEAK